MKTDMALKMAFGLQCSGRPPAVHLQLVCLRTALVASDMACLPVSHGGAGEPPSDLSGGEGGALGVEGQDRGIV